MKRADPRGRVVSVAVPPEPVQGLQPSADFTAVSQRLQRQQNQHGHDRPQVRVEGLGSRLQLDRTRVDPEQQALEHGLAAQADVLQRQARALADALSFEERARAAGVIGQPQPGEVDRARALQAERDHVYRAR